MAGVFELDNVEVLKVCSFVAWNALYVWLARTRRGAEWACRAVTLAHGGAATLCGLACCTAWGGCCDKTMKDPLSYFHYMVLLMTWGYFAFDLLWCVTYGSESLLMIMHHVLSLGVLTRYIDKGKGGPEFGCFLAAMEITNPLLQIRWFLRDSGYSKSMLFYTTETLYLILFIGIRGLFGTYVLWKCLFCMSLDIELKLYFLLFWSVSIGFIYGILGYVGHKYQFMERIRNL